MVPRCYSCEDQLCETDIDIVKDFQIRASEKFLESSETVKHKVMDIAEFLVHKHGLAAEFEEDTALNQFVEDLNLAGLRVPTLGTVYFIHCPINLYGKHQDHRKT